MKQFIDRVSKNQNQRILEVKDVIRDDSGEITRLCVDVIRNDNEVITEGTPLSANEFNSIIKDMIEIDRKEMLKHLLRDEEKAEIDGRNTKIESVLSSDIALEQKGYFESSYRWKADNSGAIRVINNFLKVLRSKVDKNVTLYQIITNNSKELIKEHNLVIAKTNNYITENINKTIVPDGSSLGVLDVTSEVVENSVVEVVNSFSEYFTVLTNIENNILHINIDVIKLLPNQSTYDLTFQVNIKNKENDELYKKINVTIEFYNSINPED